MLIKIHKLITLAALILCALTVEAKVTPVPINQFKGTFNTQFYKSGSPDVLSFEGKTLKVNENAKKYVSGMGISLNNFSGMKSIYISVLVKTVNLKKSAAVFYYWRDANGKALPDAKNAKYIARVSGTSDWTKYEKIISSPVPFKTGGITAYFTVYRGKGGNGYAMFKDPVIRIANAQDAEKIKKTVSRKRPTQRPQLCTTVFKHGFSNKMPGVAYTVERGGYGWLLMNSSQRIKREAFQLKVSAPEAIDFELYLSNGKRSVLRPAQVTTNNGSKTFTFKPLKAVWYYWGNVLLFKAGKNVPDKFNISLTFCDSKGKQILTKSIPIKTVNKQAVNIGKSSFANRMFYAYPLRRIDFSNPKAKLPWEILKYLKKYGVTSVGYLEFAKKSPFPLKEGEVISHSRFLPYNVCSPSFRKLLKKYEIPMAMNLAGIRSRVEIEPQALATKGLPFYRELLNRNKNKTYKNNELVWISDYEPYAHEGPVTKFSYAPESIEAFRKFIKASAKTKLTPQLILSKYIKQWVKFRCQQRAELIKTQVEALKEYNPKALYALCTMPLPEAGADQLKYFKRFGVDARMLDSYVDMHLPMIYGDDALFYRRTQATVSQLKKPVYVTVTCGYSRGAHRPKRLFRIMTGSAFLGAKGVYHWPGLKSMDGEFLQNMQKAMALIADIEAFIKQSKLKGAKKYVSCPGAKVENFYSAVRRNKHNYMLFLANEGKNKTLYPKIRLPKSAKLVNVLELVDRKKLSLKKHSFSVELPPRSIRIIYLGPDARPEAKFDIIDTEATERKAQALREKNAAMRRKGSAHNMSYSMDNSILEIKTPAQVVELNMDDCAVGKWQLQNKKQQIELLNSLGRDYFNYPAHMALKDIPVEIEDIKISSKNVQVTVYFKIKSVPYDGLVVRKTFIISRNIPEIKVKVRFIPAGGYRQFSFRVNNVSTNPNAVFSIGDKNKTKNRFGSIYTRKGFDYKKLFDLKNIVRRGNFSADNCKLSIPEADIKCTFDKNVKALMIWHQSNVNTMELVYDKVYPDNDPHKIKEWECSYILKGLKK